VDENIYNIEHKALALKCSRRRTASETMPRYSRGATPKWGTCAAKRSVQPFLDLVMIMNIREVHYITC